MGEPSQHSRVASAMLRSVMLLSVLPVVGCSKPDGGSGGGGPAVPSVRTFAVQISTKAGRWIEGEAKTLYEAANLAWHQMFPTKAHDGEIEVDPGNPLKGRYLHDCEIIIIAKDPGGRVDRMRCTLRKPACHRPAATSDAWELDQSNFPPAASGS